MITPAWRAAVLGCLTAARLTLPHPSPRNNLWLRRNPWFTRDVLPALRARVRQLLD